MTHALAAVELVMEPSCATAVLWGCELPVRQAETLAASLLRTGQKELSALGATRRFAFGEHMMLIVMTTGRVQVRLSLAVDRDQRFNVAHAIWADVKTAYSARP